MLAGIRIKIGDETFICPPISLGQLRNGLMTKLKEHDALAATTENFFETMTLKGEIILEALRRNYPEFDEKKLFDFLDLGNVTPIWLSILGASGFTPGEAEAVKANGTLDPSTKASPLLTDGPTGR